MTHKIEIKTNIELSDQDIDDLMVAALEGGINDWCCKAKQKLIPEGIEVEYASDLISKGGVLELHDDVEGEKHDLNLSKFMNGVAMACEHFGFNSGEELMDNHDAETANCIIQFGLFGELVYG